MTLIIIIAALLIDRFWQGIHTHRDKNYFAVVSEQFLAVIPDKVKSNQWLFLAVFLLLPFVAINIVHWFLLKFPGGLLALAFDVVILLVCVSLKPKKDLYERFIKAQHDNDDEKTADAFMQITAKDLASVDKPNSYITRLMLLQSSQQWFASIFCFLVLGPAGVVLYRCLQDYREENDGLQLEPLFTTVLAYVQWPINRLMALTFCLAGSFDDAFKGWQEQQAYKDKNDPLIEGDEVQQGNALALVSTGCAAISHDVESDAHNDTAYIRAMQGMLSRTLVIWCAVIAVLTLFTDLFI